MKENNTEIEELELDLAIDSDKFINLALEAKDIMEQADSIEVFRQWFKLKVEVLQIDKYFGY